MNIYLILIILLSAFNKPASKEINKHFDEKQLTEIGLNEYHKVQ